MCVNMRGKMEDSGECIERHLTVNYADVYNYGGWISTVIKTKFGIDMRKMQEAHACTDVRNQNLPLHITHLSAFDLNQEACNGKVGDAPTSHRASHIKQ